MEAVFGRATGKIRALKNAPAFRVKHAEVPVSSQMQLAIRAEDIHAVVKKIVRGCDDCPSVIIFVVVSR